MLGLDYDECHRIGWDSRIPAAIVEVQGPGITMVLVTGRTLSDLRRVASKLHFVDGMVAENGD